MHLAIFAREDELADALRGEARRVARTANYDDRARLLYSLAWVAGCLAARLPETERDDILAAFETSPLLDLFDGAVS